MIPSHRAREAIKTALAMTLAYGIGPKNISVNAISPGPVLTRAASGIAHFDDLMTLAKDKAPEHTLVTPDEVGISIAMLACPSMRKLTGGAHYIDGGFNIIAG